MRKRFQLTQEHINRGEPGDPHTCPVALCMSEWTDTKRYQLSILPDCVEVYDIKKREYIFFEGVPEEVSNFILDFDSERRVQPLGFEMEIPENLLAEGAHNVD